MAREKNSTFTAESAIPEEEQSTTPATKVVTPPGKKKAVGKRNGDVGGNGVSNNNGGGLGGGNGNGCGRASNNAGKNGVTSGRGNKTLGWFLDDILFENANKNSSAENSSPSPADAKSDVGTKSVNDRSTNTPAMHDEVKKRSKRSRQRQVKKPVEKDSTSGKGTPKIDYNKDDYWYYDPTSNGFYYEQMGSRGWRRHSLAAEQKRLQMEQEMMKFWKEAGAVNMAQIDGYANMALNQPYCSVPQFKYDAESDGFYFEMPSVDGWKKRQPNSNSSSSISSNSSASKCSLGFSHGTFAQIDENQPISYGAALARGQLPAACTVVSNFTYLPEPFSSDTSSMATLSEGAPTPPPRGYYCVNSGADQDGFDSMLSEHYDSALKFDDPFASTVTKLDSYDDPSSNVQHDSREINSSILNSKKQPTSYADVAAASCNLKEKKIDTSSGNCWVHRPTNLQLSNGSVRSEESSENDIDTVNEHDLLLNFNADKFISDLLSCCPNPQRFKRDLAALKTPVAAHGRIFNLDGSFLDSVDIRSAWSTLNENEKCALDENTWPTNNSETDCSNVTGDVWALNDNLDYQPPGKSKLSIWCNNNLLTSTLIDK